MHGNGAFAVYHREYFFHDMMLRFITTANAVLGVIFFVCYALQLFYTILTLFRKPLTFKEAPKTKRYAILISARNESAVLGHLLDSIRDQDYPTENVASFVVADNCSDDTAAVASAHGATVFERRDASHIGKGYALKFLLEQMGEKLRDFDACIVIDADNLLEPDYVSRMNDCFSGGKYRVITSYRNSKNYGDNWISSGSALWFLREARQLNAARSILGTSCAVSGTGFLVSRELLEEQGGWKHLLLIEDIEFSVDLVTKGERIGYCHDAILYDEQPVKLRQSWRQHVRWSYGYLQVLRHYGGKLVRGIFKGPALGCYDMLMSICPAYFVTVAGLALNVFSVTQVALQGDLIPLLLSLGKVIIELYGLAFLVGLAATVTEWRRIRCANWRKVLSVFTFPLFMFTFIPEAIAAFFVRPQWKPIEHNNAVDLSDLK